MDSFNPQEILRIAIEVEEGGFNFYQSLESKTKNEKIKNICRDLKEQEKEHKKTFEDMLDNISDYIADDYSPGEYTAYLKAIASEYIFTQRLTAQKIKEGFDDDLAAIEFAIYIEKESILTYTALKEYALTGDQPAINSLIDQERKHLVDLIALKQAIN